MAETSLIIVSTAMFLKKSWAWHGVISLLLFDMFSSSISFDYKSADLHALYIYSTFCIPILIFMLTKNVRAYFYVKEKHIAYPFVLFILLIAMYYINFSFPGGILSSYYLTRSKTGIFTYQDDIYTGKIKDFHDNGRIATEGYFRNGIIDGVWKSYYDNGVMLEIKNYKTGKLNGHFVQWYENANKEIECDYFEDSIHGTRKEWYPNGFLKTEEFYNKGLKDGLYKLYNDDGSLDESGYFKNDQKDSLWISYLNNKVYEKETFKQGIKHGIAISYTEEGEKEFEGNYTEGVADGTWKYYDKKGNIIKTEFLRNGTLVK